MRIRIIQKPNQACIDGVRLEKFEVGQQYEMGNTLGALFLAEQWAAPVDDPEPALVIPLRELDPDRVDPLPPNVIRETYPSYDDGPLAMALDRRRRSRQRST